MCLFNSLSHVWLFETLWTAARQASLFITNSRSPSKPMSIESVMPSNHLIFCCCHKNCRKFSFSSVTQSCPTLCDPMNHSTPGLPVHHLLPEFAQTYVHWVGDTTQPFHPLSPPSAPVLNLFQHQGLFQWVSSLHHVAKVLKLQHQSFQWIFRTDFL